MAVLEVAERHQELVDELIESVESYKPDLDRDLVARAFSFAAQWNAGNVKLVKGPWNKAFKEELRQFPRGKYNDQVDSGSDAFNEVALGGEFQQGKMLR